MPGKIRIIGGQWRRRKLDVFDLEGLRPTPDRVRETLFNWLAPEIEGATCLDLFAGTGALGFESLSRGAASVVMVEKNRDIARHLQQQAQVLGADSIEIICADASVWLHQCSRPFDIIFIDPPYSDDQVGKIIRQLVECQCIHPQSLIYAESDHPLGETDPRIQAVKSGKAGKVIYQLLKIVQDA